MDDKELVSQAIKATGLSVRRFARETLVREPRTVWRWLAGENPVPAAVRKRCEEILATPIEGGPITSAPDDEPEDDSTSH